MTPSSEVTTHNDDHNLRARRVGAISSYRRPVPVQDDTFDLRRILVIVVLSVGVFDIGVTESVAMGPLPYIADASEYDEGAAGCMISMYALDVAMGAPLITVLTGSISRGHMLLLLMAAFTISNGATVWVGTPGPLEVAMVSCFIAGLPHGAYFSVAGLVAAFPAEPGQRGKMVALSGVGLSVVTVTGVSAVQVLGQIYGWRSAFGFVAVIGLIALVSLWFAVPHMSRISKTRPADELSALGSAQVWLTVAIGIVGFGGMFMIYTHIAWTMTREVSMSENHVWVVLMTYGVGMVVGTCIGGWLSDRVGERDTMAAPVLMVIMLSAFYFTSQNAVLGMINFLIIGLLGSVLVPNLQACLTDVAGHAQALVAALNQAALNMASAFGAALGGWAIVSGYSYRAPTLGGATLTMLAIFIILSTIVLYCRSQAKEIECAEPRQGSTRRSARIGNV